MSRRGTLAAWTLGAMLVAGAPAASAQPPAAPEPAAPAPNPTGYLSYTEPHPLEGVSVWGALARSVMALAVVLGLLGGGVFLVRRYLPGVAGGAGAQPVRVLGRISLSPKQAVYLLHVSGRVLVVGSGGGHLTTLSEITDREEVAQLLADAPGAGAVTGAAFGGLLHRHLQAADGAGATAGASAPEASLDGIRRQIANLRALARPEAP